MVTVSHEEVTKAAHVTDKIVQFLKMNCAPNTRILGPAASPIAKIKDRYRYQCVIKYKRKMNWQVYYEKYKIIIKKKWNKTVDDINRYESIYDDVKRRSFRGNQTDSLTSCRRA